MKYQPPKDAVLLLEDGSFYHGSAVGSAGTAGGEICFNTGMTGYQEIYTDPSYYGQIIVNTNSHIGNYGVLDAEQESDSVKFKGLVCRNFSSFYSRKMADESLQEYFEEAGVVGISDVDTREIVRHIRSKGAMNAIISSEILDKKELQKELDKIPSMAGLELSGSVTTPEPYEVGKNNNGFKIAVLDLGIKSTILKSMVERNFQCKVFPGKTSFKEMEAWKPDGYFVSNGPGDPAATPYAIETTKEILEARKPFFGICLGHQLLAEAVGIPTYKMHHGHRGLNHPVKNLITGKSEITSQNHGFAVSSENIRNRDDVEVTHVNLNDDSIEGIRLTNQKAFSVQYHPEASPGPHDSRYLFDDFKTLLEQ